MQGWCFSGCRWLCLPGERVQLLPELAQALKRVAPQAHQSEVSAQYIREPAHTILLAGLLSLVILQQPTCSSQVCCIFQTCLYGFKIGDPTLQQWSPKRKLLPTLSSYGGTFPCLLVPSSFSLSLLFFPARLPSSYSSHVLPFVKIDRITACENS